MIKITRLELIRFGKFEDYVIEPKSGLNVIYGDNEAGKSTVQLFIKAMLYGIPTRGGKTRGAKDRDRIIPWGAAKAKGRIRLVKDGAELDIYREFGKRPSSDSVSVTYTATGEDYFGGDVSNSDIGECVFGMSLNMFERTVWVAQDDVSTHGKNDEITARLISLIESGGYTDVSVSGAVEYLSKNSAALKAKDRRSTDGEIDKLEKRRAELTALRAEHIKTENETRGLREKIDAYEKMSAELDDERKHLENLERSERARKKLDRINQLDTLNEKKTQISDSEEYKLFDTGAKKDTELRIKTISNMIMEISGSIVMSEMSIKNDSPGKKKLEDSLSRYRMLIFAMLGAIVLVLVLGFVFKLLIVTLVLEVLLAAVLVFASVKYTRAKRDLVKFNKNMDELNDALSGIKNMLSIYTKKLNEMLAGFGCENIEEFGRKRELYKENKARIEEMEAAYARILDGDDYDELCREAAAEKDFVLEDEPPKGFDISAALSRAADERERVNTALAASRNELEHRVGDGLSVSDIEDNIKVVVDEIDEKQVELEAYRLAAESLESVYTAIRSDYTPILNRKTEEILSRITRNRHGNIKIAEDFSAKLNNVDDNSDLKNAELFSVGTYNQIYLSIRLAVAELLLGTGTVMFLDDVCVEFDDERCQNTIETLYDICEKNDTQIFLFSCHGRDAEYVKNLSADNLICLANSEVLK